MCTITLTLRVKTLDNLYKRAFTLIMQLFTLNRLQHHPFPVATTLRDSLVLLYAVDARVLQPYCPPGLVLEQVGPYALVAVATVHATDLRLRGTPTWMGRDFVLTGYRVVVKFRAPDGTVRRALCIIRSDTDSRLMVAAGNVFTEYNYRRAAIHPTHEGSWYQVQVGPIGGGVALQARARIDGDDDVLPESSPFSSVRQARRHTGPLPWTVSHDASLDSFVAVHGHRGSWKPRLVNADVSVCTFFDQAEFVGQEVRLAAAFYVEVVDYSWDRGILLPAGEASITGTHSSVEVHDDDV